MNGMGAILEKAAKRCGDFERRWREWASGQPKTKLCVPHGVERPRNEDMSLLESWRDQEFRLIYRRCPQCVKEERERAKPKRKRKAK